MKKKLLQLMLLSLMGMSIEGLPGQHDAPDEPVFVESGPLFNGIITFESDRGSLAVDLSDVFSLGELKEILLDAGLVDADKEPLFAVIVENRPYLIAFPLSSNVNISNVRVDGYDHEVVMKAFHVKEVVEDSMENDGSQDMDLEVLTAVINLYSEGNNLIELAQIETLAKMLLERDLLGWG